MTSSRLAWPKVRPQLTAEQEAIGADWYKAFFTDVLPRKYGRIDGFSHTYAARTAGPGVRTLEIGPGTGRHLSFEDVASQEEYVAVELRRELSDQVTKEHPNVRILVGDCQQHMDLVEKSFDRILAINVLEHLDNLPAALDEVTRLLKPRGRFSVVIPCEGGAVYALGRSFTSRRQFEKRYAVPYDWWIRYDHINTAREVLRELKQRFKVLHRSFFPLGIPSVHANLVIGLTLAPTDSV